MIHHQTSWPSLVLSVLLASAILGALAWCGRPAPPKPVETTPTVVVIVTPAPTLQTVIAGPPHPRHTATPAWTPDPVLTTPTSTLVPPTDTPTPEPTSTPRPPSPTAAVEKG